MTCLAFAGEGGSRGVRVAIPSARAGEPRNSSPIKVARPNIPKPMPARWRNCRRVTKRSSKRGECCLRYSFSVLIPVSISQKTLKVSARFRKNCYGHRKECVGSRNYSRRNRRQRRKERNGLAVWAGGQGDLSRQHSVRACLRIAGADVRRLELPRVLGCSKGLLTAAPTILTHTPRMIARGECDPDVSRHLCSLCSLRFNRSTARNSYCFFRL